MIIKEGLKYTKEHEWVRIEGEKAYIGITDYAQDLLGSIVFVELPEEGDEISKGDTLSTVESVKAASDIFSPVTGKIVEINEVLDDEPEKVNESPYEFWIAALEIEDSKELNELMDNVEYEKFCEEEGE